MKVIGLILGLLIGLGTKAQVVYVMPGGSGDGSSWEKAMGRVEDALKLGQDIRLAVGDYALSGEIEVKAGQVLSGGWIPATGLCGGEAAGRTRLHAAKDCRVATVGGKMTGLTLMGGRALNRPGGGVYIRKDGVVENCIVRENRAGPYFPKVGDLLCADGSFLRKEELTAVNAMTVKGIVFWIDPEVKEECRGWAVGLELGLKTWGTLAGKEEITGEACATLEEALADTAGFRHTQAIRSAGEAKTFPAAYLGMEYRGENWYLPAFRQLKILFAEIGEMEMAYRQLKVYLGSLKNLFGRSLYCSSTEKQGEESVWVLENKPDALGGIVAMPKSEDFYVLTVTTFRI